MANEFVDRISAQMYAPPMRSVARPTAASSTPFADVLKQAVGESTALKVSAHAAHRLQQRGLQLSKADWDKVGAAVERAGQKGAKDAYVMYGNAGFVVNVPNKTVVTVMLHQEENIITNIDSVVTVPRLDQ